MKRIAIYFSNPDPEGSPFRNAGYRAAYVSLSASIQQRGGECFVVRGQESFLGAGTFTNGWRFDEHGILHGVQGPLRVDVVYNKGESFAADRHTLLVNTPALDILCRDKEQTLQQWRTLMPRTEVARSLTELLYVLAGHAPDDCIVVKPTHGWGGQGVCIGTPADVLQQVHEYPVFVQEFVDTSTGIPGVVAGNHDLRCVVVNGMIALCTVRTPAEGSLVANLARGASLTIIAPDCIPQEPVKIAEAIDASLEKYGTRIYSVDFGRSPDGRWFVFELNPQPGLTAPHWGSDVHILYSRIAKALLGASLDGGTGRERRGWLMLCAILRSMTQDEAATHWRQRARSELKAARILFEEEEPDVYGEVIFHCHLALELAFKAKYIQEHDAAAPFTHNLGELAQTLGEEWSENDRIDFDQLSDSALLARYGDEEWHTRHATKEKARMWLEKVERFLSRIQP